MKIIRWFFSHIILVILIVVVIYGYMFWGRLVDSDTPGGKAIAYLSHKFAPENKGVEQGIVADLNAGEVSREKPADGTAKDVGDTVENSMDASSQSLVENNEFPSGESSPSKSSPSELSTPSQPGNISVNDASSTIEDSTVSAGAVNVNKESFVSPDVAERLESFDKNSAAVDVNNISSISNRPGKVSVNDAQLTVGDPISSAGTGAVKTVKDSFVSPEVVEQLDSLDEDSAAADVNNTSSLSNRPGKISVNEAQLTIGDAIASAGASAVETVKEVFVSPDVEEELNNVEGSNEAVAEVEVVESSQLNPKLESADVKSSWISARTSYHQRKYELSEKSYQQVIDNTEDNYDAYGELGNVYFNQGKNAQAASAYYEAAAIFVRLGQLPRAESLIGLLWRLDPSKADELQKLIDSAAS